MDLVELFFEQRLIKIMKQKNFLEATFFCMFFTCNTNIERNDKKFTFKQIQTIYAYVIKKYFVLVESNISMFE